jgi:S-adenosylmethionine-diacylgycerolhomoserine-N-methlytransferase
LKTTGQGENRSAHAALMDKVYRRQRHFYDLTRKYYLLGRDRLVRQLNAGPGERVIEIGCGTARNLIRIAEIYPGTKLFGLDASAEMLRTANEAVARAGLSDRIALKQALAEELTPSLFGSEQKFDHAIFSYSLSMIPDWRAALLVAANAVRTGGFIHVVDFGDLGSLWPIASATLRAWLRLFHVAPRDELLTRLEAGSRRPGCALHLLPGRYAFVLKARPDAIVDMTTPSPRL